MGGLWHRYAPCDPQEDAALMCKDCGVVVASSAAHDRLHSAMQAILAAYESAEDGRLGDEPEYAYGYADGVADGLQRAVHILAAVWSGHEERQS